jgi:hypothetical protein
MNLYLVKVVGKLLNPHFLYVVSKDPTTAQELALDVAFKVYSPKSFTYEYFVENIELIASVNTQRANSLLVVQMDRE